jgi:hypothetical protein
MRLPARFAFAAVAVLLLSSCWWVGPPFYTGDPADAGPVGPGLYKIDTLGDGKPAHVYRIAWQPDGTIVFTPLGHGKDESAWSSVMTRFAVPGRDLWIVQEVPAADQTEVSYGLVERHDDELWATPAIDCDSTAPIVRAAGGDVDEPEAASNVADDEPMGTSNEMQADPGAPAKGGGATCRFRDRASLERALRAYIAANPRFAERIRFKRIGD